MVVFKVKELLEKQKLSRYKLRQYSNLSYERVNDYYFGRVKAIKVEELEELCRIFNCNTQDIVEFKENKKQDKNLLSCFLLYESFFVKNGIFIEKKMIL